jgi:Trypsin-co-occurring domain 1
MAEILVEVRPRRGRTGNLKTQAAVPENLSKRIDEVGDALRDIAQKLSSRLDEFDASPKKSWQFSEAEIKFSIDLEAEAGVIIARTKATAGFDVGLTWKRMLPEERG